MNLELLPFVTPDDDGIRPAGNPDECFYCRQKVGSQHKFDCVTVTRNVLIRVSFTIPVEVPRSWSSEQIEFKYNSEGSFCADNTLNEIVAYANKVGCACSFVEAEYVGNVE